MGLFKKKHTEWIDVSDEDYDDEDDEDGIPAGCRACGGHYPECTDSCPLFDD